MCGQSRRGDGGCGSSSCVFMGGWTVIRGRRGVTGYVFGLGRVGGGTGEKGERGEVVLDSARGRGKGGVEIVGGKGGVGLGLRRVDAGGFNG